jgi:hypothetical protein
MRHADSPRQHAPDENRAVQEREVRLTAQRILTRHLKPRDDRNKRLDTYWADLDLDLTGATLIDLDLNNCKIRIGNFIHVQFTGDAWFNRTQFTGDAWFNYTQFTGDARFDGAQFTGDARFDGAQFTGDARFDDTQFTGHAEFNRAQFIKGFPEAVKRQLSVGTTPLPPSEP